MILGAAARARRSLYSLGVFRRERLPRPVLSVGNLVLGGAGKTPHVIHMGRWLQGRGVQIGVLSRGYGRTSRGVVRVSDGSGEIVSAAEGGDEPVLIARSLPGVPVFVGESRAAAGRALLSVRGVDAFLLDDGFQHLALRRDLDLLLIECGYGLGNRRTAPLGPLREPPSHARFADALVITKCPDAESGGRTARTVPGPDDRPTAFSRMSPRGIVGGDGAPCPGIRPGDEVFAFSGLARNGTFLDTLAAAGFRVSGSLSFPDHHVYGPGDLRRISRESHGLPAVTTEKDQVRLPAGLPFPVGALRIEVEYLGGWDAIARRILDVLEKGPVD
ncbi:MAG: tetraacyldisaccharide 4'-kinase [Deltaproteobacteria bacterium]